MTRIARAIASNYVALGAQAGLLLVLTPYVIDRRGADVFGAFALVLAVTGYTRLLDLGMGPTVARHIARAPDDRSEVSATAAASIVVSAVLAAVVLVITGVALAVFGTGSGDGLGVALAIGVLSGTLQVPLRTFGHVLYGLNRLPARNAFTTLRAIVVLVATVAAIESGAGLAGFVAAGAAGEVATAVAQALYTLRIVPGLAPRLSRVDVAHVRSLTRFSVGVLALSVSSQVVLYGNTVVLSSVEGASAVALYTVAARLVEAATLALSQISDVFMPILSGLDADGRHQRAREVTRLGTLAGLVTAMPLVGLLIALGPGLIAAWVGDDFSAAALPLALLASGIAFNAPLRFLVLWSIGAGRHRKVAMIATVDAVAAVALSIALVFPLGVDGVALASLITFTVSNLLLLPWLIARDLRLPPWSAYYRPLAISLLTVAPTTVAVRIGLDGLQNAPAVVVLAAAALWLVGHAAALALLLVPGEQRRAALRLLGRRLRPN